MANFPDGSLQEAVNYCRNPDKREGVGPWCYTSPATAAVAETEGCDIPLCFMKSAEIWMLKGTCVC